MSILIAIIIAKRALHSIHRRIIHRPYGTWPRIVKSVSVQAIKGVITRSGIAESLCGNIVFLFFPSIRFQNRIVSRFFSNLTVIQTEEDNPLVCMILFPEKWIGPVFADNNLNFIA